MTFTSMKYAKTRKECRRRRYNKLKQNGICVRCGKEKAIEGAVLCEKCRDFTNDYRRKKYWEQKGKINDAISSTN